MQPKKKLDDILANITDDIKFPKQNNDNIEVEKTNTDFTILKEKGQISIEKSPSFTKISSKKKENRRSPYYLRSFKRKYDFLKSEDSLSDPISFRIDDNESKKIKAAEGVIESIINRMPDLPEREKLKFKIDSSNDIKLTEE